MTTTRQRETGPARARALHFGFAAAASAPPPKARPTATRPPCERAPGHMDAKAHSIAGRTQVVNMLRFYSRSVIGVARHVCVAFGSEGTGVPGLRFEACVWFRSGAASRRRSTLDRAHPGEAARRTRTCAINI